MNYRSFYTVGLSVGFVCMLITGLLMYSTEYDYFTAGLHTWSSVLVIVGFVGHLKNNWASYKKHFKKSTGRRVFTLCVLGLLPISLGLILQKAPVVNLVTFGENLRGSHAVREGAYTTIELTEPELALSTVTANNLSLFIKAGQAYESEPQDLYWGLTYTSTPQIAVWLEDANGHYLKTLYVTGKTADSGFYSAEQGEGRVRRPETLPVWSHKRGVQAEDGLFVPEEDSNAFDGMTAATPKGDHLLSIQNQDLDGKRLMVEVNRSYDFNEFYSKDRFPNDPIYSGSGSSGQPSLVFSAKLDLKSDNRFLLEIIGHGHHSGRNGELYPNVSQLTTAKDIVSFMVASID